jgi:5'(3')-deoxyribonucleotidase
MFENVILADYDGVLGYWAHSFDLWMRRSDYIIKNYEAYDIEHRYGISLDESLFLIQCFDESPILGKLPPYKDAIKYVKKLHEEHGYVFHIISAIPSTTKVYNLRLENIHNLFGNTAVESVILCDNSLNKKKHLEFYKGSGCYWIEDVPANAEYGLLYGLEPILMEQPYNKSYENPHMIKKVQNWKEIYHIITGE